jgi:hypothetical protein
MPKASAIFATILLSLIVWNLKFWSVIPSGEKLVVAVASCYILLLVVAGWGYVISSRKFLGWLHAFLMFGIACISGYFTIQILNGQSFGFGTGRSDNPVGWLGSVLGLLYFVLSVITGICGLGVVAHVTEKDDTGKPVG